MKSTMTGVPCVALWVSAISMTCAVLHFILLGYDGAVLFLVGYGVSVLFHLWVDGIYGRQEGVLIEENAKVSLRAQLFWNGGDTTLTAGVRKLLLILPLCLAISADFNVHAGFRLAVGGGQSPVPPFKVWFMYVVLAHCVFALPCVCLRLHKNWMRAEIRWLRDVHFAVATVICFLLFLLFWRSRDTEIAGEILLFFVLYFLSLLWVAWTARKDKGVCDAG